MLNLKTNDSRSLSINFLFLIPDYFIIKLGWHTLTTKIGPMALTSYVNNNEDFSTLLSVVSAPTK